MKFETLLIDPPWSFITYSDAGKGRAPDNHYSVMTIEDIKALDIKSIAAANAVLLLWTTPPFTAIALECIRVWGFTYKSCTYWLKMRRADVIQIGTGYHARACVEPLMIATRGNGYCPAPADRDAGLFFDDDTGGAIIHPKGRHSAKPDIQYDIAEHYRGPYVEIFSRNAPGLLEARPNWTFIGNEVTGRDVREDLGILSVMSEMREAA